MVMQVLLCLMPLYMCYTNTYYLFYIYSVDLMEQFINYSQAVDITQSCLVSDKEIDTRL